MTATEPILRTEGLKKHYSQSTTPIEVVRNKLLSGSSNSVKAVDGVDLSFYENEITGVIGESGCGKSTLLETLIGLHEPTEGEIYFDGRPTSEFGKEEWHEYRRRVRIIFQNPYEAMNPKFTVRRALMEPLSIHGMDQDEEKLHDVLERVNLTPPGQYLDKYEGQLSGGEKQRVAIARELIVDPDVILADEPVSMLDVSTQVAILHVLKELAAAEDLSVIYISHDISTVSYICEEVNVMYLGNIVESGPTRELLDDPEHPYTREMLRAIPVPDPDHDRTRSEIPGNPPDPVNLPAGCNFRDRCPSVVPPASYDFEQEAYRAVVDLRTRLEAEDADRAALVDSEVDPAEVDDESLKHAVRRAFDIPQQLSDTAAESVLDDALTHVVDGGPDDARRLLADEFESVCEREPVLYPTAENHRTKCHLHYDHDQYEASNADGETAGHDRRAVGDGGAQ